VNYSQSVNRQRHTELHAYAMTLAYLTGCSNRKALSWSKRLSVPTSARSASSGAWLTCGEEHQRQVNVVYCTVEENATTAFEVVV
jgi:hypothetical protein